MVMFDIEMAALKTVGDWLESSGWAEALGSSRKCNSRNS